MKNRLACMAMAVVLLFSFGLAYSGTAWAADTESSNNVTAKRLKIVGKAALYGFGGGLVVGVASQVFQKKPKNIFMFGSLGMYAGILLGIYVISTSQGPAPYEGPDTYEDYSSQNQRAEPFAIAKSDSLRQPGAQSAAESDLRVNFLSLNF